MKTTLYFTLTLFILVTLLYVPNSFAQDASLEYVVRQIYFRPSDIVPLEDIDATLDEWIEHVQQFYASEMERHGFGRKTFRLETDAPGNPVRYYVEGKFTKEHYTNNPIGKAYEEISEQFDMSEHLIYLIFIEVDLPNQDFSQVGGNAVGHPFGGRANITLVDFDDNAPRQLYARAWTTIAHELGHAFGLQHDFRDDHYIMSYGDSNLTNQLSSCAAEWLDAHRYFNTTHNPTDQVTTIRMLDPSFVSSPNTVRLQFEISSSAELHQAQLLTNSFSWSGNPSFDAIAVSDCKSLSGNNTTIEFVTTELAPATEYVAFYVIDEHGNFTLSERFPVDMTALLPDSEPVLIPDVNLAAAIREALNLAPESTITQLDMLGLGNLQASKKQIADLTGLQHAINLTHVDLNENRIADITPFENLTRLRQLLIIRNEIRDISPLSGLTQLSEFWIWSNKIIDISPLSELMNLTTLQIGDNQIRDVHPLAKLTNLRQLSLERNRISDVNPLIELVNLGTLNLVGNPIKDRKPLFELLEKNPNVKIYLKNYYDPLPVNLSHFRAEHTDAGVLLKWITESEVDNAGFYIYRSETKDGEFKVVNPTIIQGAGTTGERNEYRWTDTTAKPNTVYYYQIEDVSHAGERGQLATVRLRGFVSASGKLTTRWADFKK